MYILTTYVRIKYYIMHSLYNISVCIYYELYIIFNFSLYNYIITLYEGLSCQWDV